MLRKLLGESAGVLGKNHLRGSGNIIVKASLKEIRQESCESSVVFIRSEGIIRKEISNEQHGILWFEGYQILYFLKSSCFTELLAAAVATTVSSV